ncbi:uncharacterized protein LOC129765922 [Toxorhynchites rutilus septentrionalis]|uniref:uncharacterized protein LOC129765922 n=1 Tax=Toxorhynchites rutilus septentrionalis TaxID=329112 RepID=UPI00247893AC|nr:uncharacterized protein LOC129765922 [Toxorhynchites rutilus septentrionalis]
MCTVLRKPWIHPVERFAGSCSRSRPGPAVEAGERVFQPVLTGKYLIIHDAPSLDASSNCSGILQVIGGISIPNVADANGSTVLLYYQNLGGINTSLAKYATACSDGCYDIYAFTETWLNDNTISSQIFDSNYAVFRQDRSPSNSNKRSGGGVLLAIRSRYKSLLLSPPVSLTVEQLWVSIEAGDSTLFICVVYIPPDRVKDNILIEKHLSSLDWIISLMGAKNSLTILGDFNLRDVRWEQNTHDFYFPTSDSSTGLASRNLLDAYRTSRLGQKSGVMNCNNRMLDLCFVSEEMCSSCSVIPAPAPLVKSCIHHPPLLISIDNCVQCDYKDTTESIYYNFDKANFDEMNNFLSNVNWDEELANRDVNDAASTVSCIIIYAIDQFVPKRTNRVPLKPAWSNSKLKRLKKRKRAALREHAKLHTESTKTRYSKANLDYRRLNDQLHQAHLRQLQRRLKSNPKRFWQYVNSQRKETGLPSTMTNGVVNAATIPDIAELFRKQFSSVFSNERTNSQDVAAASRNVPFSSFSSGPFTITREMVISAGSQLKSSRGSGPDGIPSLVLKRCLIALATPLANTFNLSLRSGDFPSCWKESYVFPIHKKGCKRTVSNYRGIAALSATSKLLELIILEELVQNFAHCISMDQHGFMSKRSTTTNLVQFTSYIIREIEQGHQVDAIYTDLSAAFDKMNHDIALAKYDRLGVQNDLLAWLSSYLTG